MHKIGPNKFMGGGGVCGRGEGWGAFCLVCIFHNQKMHVYLIFCVLKVFTFTKEPLFGSVKTFDSLDLYDLGHNSVT